VEHKGDGPAIDAKPRDVTNGGPRPHAAIDSADAVDAPRSKVDPSHVFQIK
jgi:hypothetical protein